MSTDGPIWLSNLPENPCQERDDAILKAIDDGIVVLDWINITSIYKEHTATFQMLSDAAYVLLDDNKRFRFPVSAKLNQQCANMLDSALTTEKLIDLFWKQSELKFDAITLPANPQMSTTSRSKQYNELIENKRQDQNGSMFIGKAWILSNRLNEKLDAACNYGFFSKQSPSKNRVGVNLYQTNSVAHNYLHTDYSQLLYLVKRSCIVDDKEIDIESIMKDSNLCQLMSYDIPMKFTKQLYK